MLIQGDNLLALKALEQDFAGKIKCVYIDPPFNTGGAFEHYDDNLEHSIWLNMIRDRLQLLHRLLSPDGALVVNLDDTEMAYCKVLLDETFGRHNYVLTIVVEAATPSSFKTVNTGPTEIVQYLLFFAKDKTRFQYQPQYIASYEVDLQHFSRFIVNFDAPAKDWTFQSINDHILSGLGFAGTTPNAKWAIAKKTMGAEEATEAVKGAATRFALENCHRVFETKTLQKPSKWLHEHIKASLTTDHVIDLPRDGMESVYLYKGRQLYFLGKGVREVDGEKVVVQPLSNLWDDLPTNNLQKEGGVDFPAGKKPEALVARIIRMISDKKSDIVLDSFGGSGTTAAVAHKMGRRWVMVELGEHCRTHIIPRLRSVIDGTDHGGISADVQWKGGGGFKFYTLAETLLVQDKELSSQKKPVYVINRKYDATMLIRAVCKIENYSYRKNGHWHGASSEHHFLYVTTNLLDQKLLNALCRDLSEDDALLVYCTRRVSGLQVPDNIEIKKIPRDLLAKCTFEEGRV